MNKSKNNLVVLAFFLIPWMVWAQSPVVFKGKVVDFLTYQPLENACIHNLSTGNMAFSNKEGNFSIMAKKQDTLVFSRVGYDMNVEMITDSMLSMGDRIKIKLIVKTLMLRNVTIYAMKPYPLFIKDLIKPTPHDKKDVLAINLPSEEKERIANAQKSGNLLRNTPLESPLTALYNKFSRKKKLERIYYSLVSNQEEIMRLIDKYNPHIVHQITSLQGVELEDFMLFCSFSYHDLSLANEHEIALMIREKYTLYAREKNSIK
jgi:hypothetical protein